MIGFNSTCKGASHIKTNKICQDYSYCESTSELSIALVSDGHGGEHYFRSNIGSELVCQVSKELIQQFVANVPDELFAGVKFTQFGVMDDVASTSSNKQINALRRLSAAIISTWRDRIKEHVAQNPATEEELTNVAAEFHNSLSDEERVAKVYGCTLMGYVQTPRYWFAFQIGDGKCFSFHKDTGPIQPILWDDACFLNKTTSICDSNAQAEFRFSYQGDGNFPYAVILGSDGLDDSLGEDKNLINFYIQILKLAHKSNIEDVKKIIDEDLPILSSRGSQDDMSVSVLIDETVLEYAVNELTEWQLNTVIEELNQNKARIHKFHKERKSLEEERYINPKADIDYKYAIKEINTAILFRKKLIARYDSLAKELNEECPCVFNDDIPYEKVVAQVASNPLIKTSEPVDTFMNAKRCVNPRSCKPKRTIKRGFRDRKNHKLKSKFLKKKGRRNKRL